MAAPPPPEYAPGPLAQFSVTHGFEGRHAQQTIHDVFEAVSLPETHKLSMTRTAIFCHLSPVSGSQKDAALIHDHSTLWLITSEKETSAP